MRIHCLQHLEFETPGTIVDWAQKQGHQLSYTHLYLKDFQYPSLEKVDALLIMGGSMNVSEEITYPWLIKEKNFIKLAIDRGLKILGICLGSQLLAEVLGAAVFKGESKEIGFFPVNFTQESMAHPLFNHLTNPGIFFQWHGDTFNMPKDAILLGSSAAFKHQGFLVGTRLMGLQFHIEMNQVILENMLYHESEELKETGLFIQPKVTLQKGHPCLELNKKAVFHLLDKFFGHELQ